MEVEIKENGTIVISEILKHEPYPNMNIKVRFCSHTLEKALYLFNQKIDSIIDSGYEIDGEY